MSRSLWRIVVWVSALALSGCAAGGGASLRANDELRATVQAVYEAVDRGDERAYRQLVLLGPRDAYSDALTTTMFASIRLYQEVERRLFQSPSTRPRPSLGAVDYRHNAREMMRAVTGWTFTVRRDRGTIDALANSPGAPTLKRVNGRWLLVPTRWDTPIDTATYQLAVAHERDLANALATARDAVVEGKATSIEDVNGILRRLLTAPTTQP